MRQIILTLAIVLGGLAQASAMPINQPTTFPAPGVFCGFLKKCDSQAEAPRPDTPPATLRAKRPAK